MSLKCRISYVQICGPASRALCQYGTGLKFKDLLFSIFSRLNEVSQRGRLLKSFPTYLVAQKIPHAAQGRARPTRIDQRGKSKQLWLRFCNDRKPV